MNRETRRLLVAYDIPCDRRRTHLAHFLQSFGDRVQFSVFIADVTPTRRLRLVRGVEARINEAEDSVLLCDLGLVLNGLEKRFVCLGRQRPITEASSFVI